MRAVIFGDIHGCVDRVEAIFTIGEEMIRDAHYALITGDYGEDNTSILQVSEILRKHQILGISTYGNHEPDAIRRAAKSTHPFTINGIILLPLGIKHRIGDITILSIGGNRGSGKKWSHWRDHQIEDIIRSNKDIKVDIVLSHEMPYGLADRCRGDKHCGQLVLRRLVEELKPRIFIGGHLHTFPEVSILGNSIILKVGGVSNRGHLKNSSFFSILNLGEEVILDIYRLDMVERSISKVYHYQL